MGAVMDTTPSDVASASSCVVRSNHTGPGGIIPGATYGTSWYGTHAVPSSSSSSSSSWLATEKVNAFALRRIPGGAVNEKARLHRGSRVPRRHCVTERTPGAAVTTQ